jgi:pantoate--beta-alanine ligase
MGFLHAGHLSLVERARRECGLVVASIFVNPLQFGPGEDYAGYPRAPRRDRRMLRDAGCNLCFEPSAERLYPPGFSTRVRVRGLDEPLCGRFRPGHFDGVATVVLKLLAAGEPDRLYLGGKDYQQAILLERMARDLDLAVRVVICPTVREPDGLAMSSRNVYLEPEERRWAPRLYRALRAAAGGVRRGELRSARAAEGLVARTLAGGPGRLQYVELLSAEDLSPVRPLRGRLVLALAYFLGRARLIDNVRVTAPERSGARRGAGRFGAARAGAAPTRSLARRKP